MGIKDFFGIHSISKYTNNDGVSFNLPESIEKIKFGTFDGYEDKVVDIIGPGVKKVEDNAFFNFTNLKLVHLEAVTDIEDNAFNRCKELKNLYIPAIERIGDRAFEGCENLEGITVGGEEGAKLVYNALSEDVRKKVNIYVNEKLWEEIYTEDGGQTFDLKGVKLITEGVLNIIINRYKEKVKKIDAPDLMKVTEGMFEGFVNLETIALGRAVSVDEKGFKGCENLKGIDIPLVYGIGKEAFDGCTSLKVINMPSIKKIGEGAFNRCNAIESVETGSDEGAKVFYDALPNYDDLPNIVKKRKVNILADKEAWFLERAYSDDQWKTFNLKEVVEIILGSDGPDDILKMLYMHKDTVEKIIGPNVISINENAFQNFTKLTSIDFQSLEEIGKETFKGCTSLEEVNIPRIERIGEGAFEGCDKLSKIYIGDKGKYNLIRERLQENIRDEVKIFVGSEEISKNTETE